MTARARIAPSSTGDRHGGTAPMALFTHCFAKTGGGRSLLRIEDTDPVRSPGSAEDASPDAMRDGQRGASCRGDVGRCVHKSAAESEPMLAAGVPHLVGMKVLLKSDGLATDHLADVVEDHLMEVTHGLCGEDWLTSAPKHLSLYSCFGWEPPPLCHMPLSRSSGDLNRSRRKNPPSTLDRKWPGLPPEALRNYLGQMVWSVPDGRRRVAMAEMRDRDEGLQGLAEGVA